MVVINGITTTTVPKTRKSDKKAGVRQETGKGEVAQTTQLANAVSHTIRRADEAEIERARVQYDLPEGYSRKAMQEYMDVFNHARKEELAQLIGVDVYI